MILVISDCQQSEIMILVILKSDTHQILVMILVILKLPEASKEH